MDSMSQETNGMLLYFCTLLCVMNFTITDYLQIERMSSTETDLFLEMVKKTFSDVLFPIEYVDKQEFLGKGNF